MAAGRPGQSGGHNNQPWHHQVSTLSLAVGNAQGLANANLAIVVDIVTKAASKREIRGIQIVVTGALPTNGNFFFATDCLGEDHRGGQDRYYECAFQYIVHLVSSEHQAGETPSVTPVRYVADRMPPAAYFHDIKKFDVIDGYRRVFNQNLGSHQTFTRQVIWAWLVKITD